MLLCLMGHLSQNLPAKTCTSSCVQTAVIAQIDGEFTVSPPISYLVHKAMLSKHTNDCFLAKHAGDTDGTTIIQSMHVSSLFKIDETSI